MSLAKILESSKEMACASRRSSLVPHPSFGCPTALRFEALHSDSDFLICLQYSFTSPFGLRTVHTLLWITFKHSKML